MPHPYKTLPARAFWRTAVAQADRDHFPGLYEPRFKITPDTAVATAGSCFAQHIGSYLKLAGCNVCDVEPAPRGMSQKTAQQFGYGVYSARYGNIYTAKQLRQLLEEVSDPAPAPCEVWQRDGTYLDALRPTIEPFGLTSPEEVRAHRAHHLARLVTLLSEVEVFVFTLGLTESWMDTQSGRVYPVCPGVAGGQFDPMRHEFRNFTCADIVEDLHAIQGLLRRYQPDIKLLLTVSPVPLTATASGEHVLSATSYSKAVLRAAAGQFVQETTETDYFPSLEIITAPASGGPWFEDDMRAVRTEGVEKVMLIFFQAHGILDAGDPDTDAAGPAVLDEVLDDDLICEDLLLQAFSK